MGTEADGGGRRPGEGWWDTVYSSDEHFRLHFRMSRSTFAFVCGEVADVIRKDPVACPVTVIPVPERLAICLWRLVNGESLTNVAKRFSHGRVTCHRIFHDVCAAIMGKVVGKEILWPDAAAMAANASKFQALSGIQGVIGNVYTTRFAITAPKHNTTDYCNRRATARNSSRSPSYSITVQASVNADGAFTNVFAGHPGAKSDEETLLASTLSRPELTGQILGERMRLVGGVGYPLTEWMMVPYSHQNLTPAQLSFNEGVEKVIGVGVETFRRFIARWSFLQKRIEIKLKGEKKNDADLDVDLAVVLEVCCALHNICERLGDPLDPELLQGVKLNDGGGGMVNNDNLSPSASDLRDALADDLVSMGAV
ncbi:hypothetical protein ZWY2020_045310 [Hordeum vulgare]|nr:hypothetical protein ZWY2020_045310 [Hordeum vulgare]